VGNLNDLDAIFGDDSFYIQTEQKEEENDEIEPQESEYNMDQLYKIPISHGEIDNMANYTTACALFWFKDFDSMMSTKGLEHPLHF